MKNLLLDSTTHDLAIIDNNLVYTSGSEQIKQKLKSRLLMYLGEWFLDTTYGVPYYTQILKKNPDVPNIDNIFKAVISDTTGVVKITEFSSVYDSSNREYRLSFKYIDIYDEENELEV